MIMRCVRTVLAEIKLNAPADQRPHVGGIDLAVKLTGLSEAAVYGLV